MSKKRIIITGVCAGLCVVLGIVLGILLWQQSETSVIENNENLRVEMLPKVEFKDVKRIDIKNSHGGYSLVNVDGTLVLEENKNAQLDIYKLQFLLSNVCQTYYAFKADVTEQDYINYGLGEGESEAQFTLTTLKDTSYTVFVGDKTLDNKGRYVRFPEENAIFILEYDIENDILGTPEYLIDKSLVYPSDMNHYMLVNNFSLKKNGEEFINIKVADETERNELNVMGIHLITNPAGNYASMLYNGVLQRFCASDPYTGACIFTASEVCSFDISYANLAKYGINPYGAAYELYFETPVTGQDGKIAAYVPNYLFFSEKQRDENGDYFYYVYSATQGSGKIGRIEAISVDFFEWGIEKWISINIFETNIMNIDTISFESGFGKYNFKLSGSSNEVLSVVETGSGYNGGIDNFRNLWSTMLRLTHDGYANLSKEEEAALTGTDENKILTVNIVTRAGQSRELCFYKYSAVRVFYTINGKGEYYVPLTMVNKIIADVEKYMGGITIDPEASV